ncbi:MAG TPA: phosphodiesterase [Burkholderiales bacterium]|nr:phosphodiesterase [Burkholderiales bacterium]
MKLVHLSDTHLVAPGNRLYGLDPKERLQDAIAHINAHHADAEICVLTGDLVHWGEPQAYELLAQALERLRVPCVPLLGNHDARGPFRARFPDAPSDGQGFVQGVRRTTAGTLVFLDTNADGRHHGRYCAARQQWLEATLAATPGELLLFMHHPPFDIGISSIDAIGLSDRQAFADIVEPHARRVRHLFLGHAHRPVCGSWLGIPYSIVRGTNHQVALDLSPHGEDIPGSHEPPAYAVALIEPDRTVVHLCEYLDASPRFSLDAHEALGRRYAFEAGF